MVWRMMWFTVAAIAISYGSYLVIGSALHARASGAYDPIIVRDVLGPGSHHLSGMIMVPTPCDQLSVRTEELSSTTYMLAFKTWREPSVDCTNDEVPRHFRAILFAPAVGVQFAATLDGAGLPVVVLPATPLVQPIR